MMTEISYSGYRFPPEIIQQAIWLYLRFNLSFRAVEELLAERGIVVELRRIFGDGVNQVADLVSGATSIPSRNLTPLMTFGN
jgi:hypothetical protein